MDMHGVGCAGHVEWVWGGRTHKKLTLRHNLAEVQRTAAPRQGCTGFLSKAMPERRSHLSTSHLSGPSGDWPPTTQPSFLQASFGEMLGLKGAADANLPELHPAVHRSRQMGASSHKYREQPPEGLYCPTRPSGPGFPEIHPCGSPPGLCPMGTELRMVAPTPNPGRREALVAWPLMHILPAAVALETWW